MALIKCADCGKEVSSAAPACPSCGRPTGTITSGATVTTELTSKKYKTMQLCSFVAGATGVVMLFTAPSPHSPTYTVITSLLIVGGIAGWITAKMKIWWHHK